MSLEPIVLTVWSLALCGGALGGLAVVFTARWLDDASLSRWTKSLRVAREAFIGAVAALALLAIGSLGSLFEGAIPSDGKSRVATSASPTVAAVDPAIASKPTEDGPVRLSAQAALVVLGGSVLAGFVGRRLLDTMSKTLIRNVEERVDAIEKENHQLKVALDDNGIIDTARPVVLVKHSSVDDLKLARDKLIGVSERRPGFRPAAILLGHVLKRLNDYPKAMVVMERFIHQVAAESGLSAEDVRRNQTDGFFNLACYRSLGAAAETDATKQAELLERAVHDLRTTIALNPEYLKEALLDADLAFLREKRPEVFGLHTPPPPGD